VVELAVCHYRIFAFVYLVLYPGLGNFKGMLGWTSARAAQN
jgi:hypothetical protein